MFNIRCSIKMSNLSELEKIIKVKFNNRDLLEQALVHRSYLNEKS